MEKKPSFPRRQIGAFVTIPFVLLVPIVIGWWIGKWLDQKMGTPPYLMYLFLILGLIAGGLECYRIVRDFGSEE